MAYSGTAIMGRPMAQLAQLESLLRRVNTASPDVAPLYLELGPRLGVRGDLGFAQALHETHYFRCGGLVRPEQNNYAGLGATGPGERGASFPTPAVGVMAHLQHLYAYASTDPLPAGMEQVDPRFHLVRRGSATQVGDLNGKWAVPGDAYGQSIDGILGRMLMEPTATEPYSITQALLSPESQNRPGRCSDSGCWQGVQGIVVHRTASPSMNAWAIRRYFNDAPDGRFASSHFVVDDQVLLQLIPIGEVAYHTAGRNLSLLGIETCEHNWGEETWPETYRKLVWLTAYLARTQGLDISQVTGHFQWDPVDRPYDPTHLGWRPGDGQATGLLTWSTFIADVSEQLHTPPPPTRVPVVVVDSRGQRACTDGILVDGTTYVPIRAYTACIAPQATVTWDPTRVRVTVSLLAGGEGEPAAPTAAAAADGAGTLARTATVRYLPFRALGPPSSRPRTDHYQ